MLPLLTDPQHFDQTSPPTIDFTAVRERMNKIRLGSRHGLARWMGGDVNGHGAFTHTSVNDAEIVLEHILVPHAVLETEGSRIGGPPMRYLPIHRSAGLV